MFETDMHTAGAVNQTRELSVDLATTLPELAAMRDAYEGLQSGTGNTSPFALYEWHYAWCAHFLNIDRTVNDALLIYVVRDSRSKCVAIVPLVASSRSFGPLKVVSVELLGADPSTTESRTPLIVPGYEQAVLRTVRAHLARRCAWDWITWGSITAPFGHALAAGTSMPTWPGAPGYVLDLPSSWEEFRSGLKRNIRESLRHCYNSLNRDGHSFSFEVVTASGHVERAILRFLELHAMRSAMTGTVEHPNHFAGAVAQRFLFAVCDSLAARGALRIFQLRIGGEVIAVRIGYVVGDCLYLYYSGFDPAWSRYGVMTTTLAEALKYAIRAGMKTVNLSRGTDASKTRWGPRRVDYVSMLELRPRLRSRIAHHFYVAAQSDGGFEHWCLRRLGRARRVWN